MTGKAPAVQLHALQVEEVSGVDKPANYTQTGGATGWLVLKEDGTPVFEAAATTACTNPDCDKRVVAGASKCADGHAQTQKEAAVPEPQAPEGGAAVETITKADAEAMIAAAIEKANEAAEARVAKAEADAADAIEKATKASDELDTAAWITKAAGADYSHLPAEAGVFGPVLRAASIALPETVFTELDRVLKACSEQLAQSALVKSAGRDIRPSDGSSNAAYAKLQAHATELMKSDAKLTPAGALAAASLQLPEVAAEYRTSHLAAAGQEG